jgi:hypothetical protein
MADSVDVSGIASSILTDAKGILLAQGTDFLKNHPAALSLLETAAKQAAQTMVDIWTETDPARKADLRASVADDMAALKEEGFSIIVDAEAAAKSTFWTILDDVGRIAIGLAPVLLKAIPIPL